ncbi:MAG: nitroreductase [Firmicutes bacterium]|nr:nitroreductase [Bacillota bacterium]
MNETLKTIERRTSLRRYKDVAIKEEDLELLLYAAQRAPTAGNMMLYSILLIRDQHTKDVLSKTCDNQPFIAKAPLVMVFLADVQRWFDYYRVSEVKEFCLRTGLEFRGPNLGDLFISVSDALIAAQNVVIAAESLGIGSCYIGDIMENYETHRELLDLPEYVFPIAMLCLGYYPDDYKPIVRHRFEHQYFVFEEKYHRLNEEELTAMFAQLEASIPQPNKYGAENAAQYTFARKTGAAFSCEMDRSIRKAMENWQGGNPLVDQHV